MAITRVSSVLSSKHLLHNLFYRSIRPLNTSSAVPSVGFAEKQDSTTLLLPFTAVSDDVKGLFSSTPTGKLIRSFLTLKMVATEPVVDFGTWAMRSRLMKTALFRGMVLGVTKATFFDHFVAGRNHEEAGEIVKMLWNDGLGGMLDYGLENAYDNVSCDLSTEAFIQTIESTTSLPHSSVSGVVVKITAICPVNLVRRMSDLLRWEYKEKCNNLPWKVNTLPIFTDSSPLYHTLQKPEALSSQEEKDLELAHQRLHNIIKKCQEANVPLVIDAEETWIQPAIDYFTYSSTILHSKDDSPMIYGTFQAYLKDTKERLVCAKKAADRMGLRMGVKLVRGAYMSAESQIAASLGYDSPIHNSIQHTHDNYNGCAAFMLNEIANGPGSLVLATHNFESGKLAAAKAQDLGIWKDRQKLQFAQLYGMAEAMTYGLKNAGFQVSKYLPFGPVEQIIPYLVRRAEENKGMLSTSSLDRQLMKVELKKRVKAAIF